MVPEGWKILAIGDLGKVTTGSTPKTAEETYYGGEIPFVSPADLGGKKIITTALKTLTEEGYEKTRSIPEGSTLFCCIGSVGKIGLAGRDVAVNQQINAVTPSCQHNNDFVYYALSYRAPAIAITAAAQVVPIINKSNFSNQLILSPPLPEQKKIAQILSTWDQAITATERLLENSQQRKKGLMQQLLTGKKRLPGFEGEWVSAQLGDLVEITSGSSKAKYIDQIGDKYIIDMGSVTRTGRLIPTKKTSLNGPYLAKGQLVMPKDDIGGGNIIGRVGVIPENEKYLLADHVYALTPHQTDSQFLGYLINSEKVNKSLRRRANGTAQLGLGKKDVQKQAVLIPSDPAEQRAIGEILLSTDQEFDLLSKRLIMLKQEKKALMQQLLTGKRRVQVDTEAA